MLCAGLLQTLPHGGNILTCLVSAPTCQSSQCHLGATVPRTSLKRHVKKICCSVHITEMSLLQPRRGEVDFCNFALRVHSVDMHVVQGSSLFKFARCGVKLAEGTDQGGRRVSFQSSLPQCLRLGNIPGTLLHQTKGVANVRILRINLERLAEEFSRSLLLAARLLVDSPCLPKVDAVGTLLGAHPEGLPGGTAPAVDLRSRPLPPSLEAGQRQVRVGIARVDVEDLPQYGGGLPPLPRAFEVTGLPEHSPDVASGVAVIVTAVASFVMSPGPTATAIPRFISRGCFWVLL